jgi:hypothetical protein
MSPEQILGKVSEIDGRADVYGLGATLYEVLAGQPLFQKDGVPGLLRAVLHERPEPLRTRRPDLRADFDNVVMKALEKEKNDRYTTATEMRTELLRLAAGDAVVGRPVSAATHAVRRSSRFLPLAAVLLLAAVAGGMWLVSSAKDSAREELVAQRETAPVPLSIHCTPGATVRIDDEVVGETPLTVDVTPGEHEVVLSQKGFVERREQLTVKPGLGLDLERVLIADDPADPEALQRVAQSLGVDMEVSEEGGLFRLGGTRVNRFDEVVVASGAAPVLRVRAVDALPESGELRIMAGERTLFTTTDLGTAADGELVLPPEVLDALAGGEDVQWGVRTADAEPSYAVLTLVEEARRGAPGGSKGEPATGIVREGIARAASDKETILRGFLAARRKAEAHPDDAELWETVKEALEKLQLQTSAPWTEAQRHVVRIRQQVVESEPPRESE